MNKLSYLIAIFISASCTNFYQYPTYSEAGNVFMIVENPAGTNVINEYNQETNKFRVEEIEGKERKINYLPYPGNYGFIPSTRMAKDDGGDGNPLNVLVIGSTIKKANILEFVPVGVLKLFVNGEQDDKIIGVVVNSKYQVIDCKTYKCLDEQYPGILSIIKIWFENYSTGSVIEVAGWGDEKEAQDMIRKWRVDN